jgi:hypothetical protein
MPGPLHSIDGLRLLSAAALGPSRPLLWFRCLCGLRLSPVVGFGRLLVGILDLLQPLPFEELVQEPT